MEPSSKLRWQDRLKNKMRSSQSSQDVSQGSENARSLLAYSHPVHPKSSPILPGPHVTDQNNQSFQVPAVLGGNTLPHDQLSSVQLSSISIGRDDIVPRISHQNFIPLAPSGIPSPDLWAEALLLLRDDEKDIIQEFWSASGWQPSLSESMCDALGLIHELKARCEGKAYKFQLNGKDVLVRDVVGKVVFWLKKFKEVGDVAVSFDPTHAALPWAGVRFILQVAIAESEQMGDLLLTVERISCLINRGAMYQKLYQPGLDTTEAVENLRRALVLLYSTVLQMISLCLRLFTKSTTTRTIHALFNPNELSAFLEQCERLEVRVEYEAQICERFRNRKVDLDHQRLLDILRASNERTDDRVANLLQKISSRERLETLDWISKVLYGANHQLVRDKRTDGTCGWLLEHSQYREWQEAKTSKILWLYGTAGTGKTFLVSRVIDEIQASLTREPNQEGFAFFYCNGSEPERRDPLSVLRAFVRQLSTTTSEQCSIQTTLKSYVKKSRLGGSVPTINDCKELLLEFVNSYPRTTLILDALDECDDTKRAQLVEIFEFLTANALNPLKIFISSRPDGDIKEKLRTQTNIGIHMTYNDNDISKFIKTEIVNHRRWTRMPPNLQVEIITVLQEKSQGMFQWANLQIKQLLVLQLESDIRERLGKLPVDLKAAYDEIFDGIPVHEKKVAHRAFQWVMCAQQPLTTREILPAISQDGNCGNTGDLLPLHDLDEDLALEFCHNLLVIDPVRGVWVPSHFSVVEYFETHVWSYSQANCLVLKVCMASLYATLLHNREKRWKVYGEYKSEYKQPSRTEQAPIAVDSRMSTSSGDPLDREWFRYLSKYARLHWQSHAKSIVDDDSIKSVKAILDDFLGMSSGKPSSAYDLWYKMTNSIVDITVAPKYTSPKVSSSHGGLTRARVLPKSMAFHIVNS